MEQNKIKTVLIVDDEPDVREVVKDALVAVNAEFLEAWDGTAALTLLQRVQVDLIICDYNMPTMNGIEFLKTLKERDRVIPPFIMITGRSSVSLMKEAWDLGTTHFVEKPFGSLQLASLTEKLLNGEVESQNWSNHKIDLKVLREKDSTEVKMLLKKENVDQLKSYCHIFGISMSSQIDLLIESFLKQGAK